MCIKSRQHTKNCSMKGRDLLTIYDLTKLEIEEIFKKSEIIKAV